MRAANLRQKCFKSASLGGLKEISAAGFGEVSHGNYSGSSSAHRGDTW